MGRFWLGVGILLVFLTLGIGITAFADATHTPICQELEAAAAASLSGDLPGGIALAEDAMTRWEERWHAVAIFSDHAPMDEIDGLFAQLEVYGKTGSAQEFAACCARISKLVGAMAEAHSPSWWNLL